MFEELKFKDLLTGCRFTFTDVPAKRGRPRTFTKVSTQIYATSSGERERLRETTRPVREIYY